MNAAQWAAEETFLDCQNNLEMTVKRFQKHHGGDWEELWSEAQLCFLFAYRSFDPSQGTDFKTWLYTKVWYGLHEVRRRKLGRDGQKETISMPFDVEDDPVMSWHEKRNRFSMDSKKIIALALLPKEDLTMLGVQNQVKDKQGYLPCIALFLREIGWSLQRIAESFGEIRDALQDSLWIEPG